MKFVALVFLSGLIAALGAAPTCPKTVCGEPATDKCASYDSASTTWTVKDCPTGKYCDIAAGSLAVVPGLLSAKNAVCKDNPTDNTNTNTPTNPYLFPGQACTKAEECHSNTCTSGKCVGVAKDGTCAVYTVLSDKAKICDVNLYCNSSNKCADGVAAGASCTNNATCAGVNKCINSKCVAPLTVALDGKCDDTFDCEAGLICKGLVNRTCQATVNYTKGSYLATCTDDADCEPASCQCTFINKTGKGFCQAMTDGSVGKDLMTEKNATYKRTLTETCVLDYKTSGMVSLCFKFTLPTYTPATYDTDTCYETFKAQGGAALYTKPAANNDDDDSKKTSAMLFSVILPIFYFFF